MEATVSAPLSPTMDLIRILVSAHKRSAEGVELEASSSPVQEYQYLAATILDTQADAP
jgi:hypothetical protein